MTRREMHASTVAGRLAVIVLAVALLVCGAWPGPNAAGQPRPERPDAPSPAPAALSTTVSLTDEERDWLRQHPVIRVVQDPGWPPVEFADDKGEPSGISNDYLCLIEQRLGITFERVRGLSWQEAYERLKRWDIDMTMSVAATPERDQFWAFTKPYMTIPIVILTHADVTYISGMHELAGKKVAVVDGYVAGEHIARDFPGIRLVKVATVKEGLDLLQKGEVFALADNMLVIGYYLARLKMPNLTVAGETPYVNAQCIAVRKDWAPLAGIIQKVLDSIPESQRIAIYAKWVPLRYQHGFDYRLLWQVLGVSAVIVAGLVFWNRRLSKEIQQRIRTQAALESSERRFRQLFDAASIPLGLVDEKNVLSHLNSRFVQTFGYTLEEIPTLDDWMLRAYPDPEYRRYVVDSKNAAVRRAAENKTDVEPIEYRVTCKNGEVRTVVISGTLMGNGILASFFDITDRKRAEDTLRESEACLRSLLEAAPEGILIQSEGRYVYVNPALVRLFGASTAGDLLGTDIMDQVAPEYRGEIGERIRRQREMGETVQYVEMDCVKMDGTRIAVETTAVFVQYHGRDAIMVFFRDIGERRRAEAERRRLITAIEQTSDIVIVTDRDGIIQYVNPAFVAVTGYAREEAVGSQPSILKSGHQDDAFYRELWTTISGGQSWQGQLVNKRKDGTIYTELATISPVRSEAGEIVNYVAIKRDITEQLHAAEEQARLEDQLRQSQKVEAIGRLAGGVAHDFNNMLGIILGYGEVLLQELHHGDPMRDSVEQMVLAGRRSAALTSQLLAFSRRQALQPEVLDLNAIIRNIEKMMQRLIGEDIAVALRLAEHLARVEADPGQIEQVIVNLALNARDAIPDGGTLVIETANADLDEQYCESHMEVTPGRYVMVAMSDTGCGMDNETMSQIFEPFFTTKAKGKGTGLGLATVYGIVRQSGGSISVYSEPGRGTTFRIYLPQTQAKRDTDARPAPAALIEGNREHILVVEDEAALRRLAETVLSRLNYRVTVAANGGEALLLVEEKGLNPDLVITDVVMPGMSGTVLIGRLRRTRPGLKTLYMSGYTDDAIVHHGLLDSGTPFIQKPFSIRELSARVRQALQGEPARDPQAGAKELGTEQPQPQPDNGTK